MDCAVRYAYSWRQNARRLRYHLVVDPDGRSGRLGELLLQHVREIRRVHRLNPAGNLVQQAKIVADGSVNAFGGDRTSNMTGFSQAVGGRPGITLTTSVWCNTSAPEQSVTIGLDHAGTSILHLNGSWTGPRTDNNALTPVASASSSKLRWGAQCVAMPGSGPTPRSKKACATTRLPVRR